MQQKIYSLLMVTHRDMLEKCYRQVFFSDTEIPAVKTFDDYLTDFYLYLYEGKPKHIEGDVKGYYLQQVRDEKALPGWLHSTFRYFLLDENKILRNMQESLSEYRRDLASSLNSKPIDLTLMHVAFAIAWFNQNETSEDKYLFFRSAYKHFKGFYAWPNSELDDKDVALALGIGQGALRTRTSRLCAKVKSLVKDVNDAHIATLNKQSLDIAKEIFDTPNPNIEAILEKLLDDAERGLPQYEDILKLRKEKRESMVPFEKMSCCYELSIGSDYALEEWTRPSAKKEAIDKIENEQIEESSSTTDKYDSIETNHVPICCEEIDALFGFNRSKSSTKHEQVASKSIEKDLPIPEPSKRIIRIFKEIIEEK